MKNLQKTAVFLLFVLCIFFMGAEAVAATSINAVRLGNQNGQGARLVLDLSDRPQHQVFLLKNPYRVVIDAENTSLKASADSFAKSSNIVKDLRIGKVAGKDTRIVVETKGAAVVKKAFFLPPQSGFSWRLVVDIVTASAADFEAEKAKNPVPKNKMEADGGAGAGAGASTDSDSDYGAAPSKNDAIGNLVAKQEKAPAYKPVIMIDAGHGGRDSGAVSVSGYYEKYITLKMAKELKERLEVTGKYRVKLTRSDDRALALRQRVQIARNAKADLFISIHADSARNSNARGLSVYTLSERSSDKEAEALAERENKADAIINMDFSDKTPEVANILIDLARRDTMNTSKDLANFMAAEFSKSVRVLPDTHRYAGFAVLKAQDIPSVLVEIGYLSNRSEERLIRDINYRDKLARAMMIAIGKFFDTHEVARGE